MEAQENKKRRLEKIGRSCLNCGHQNFDYDGCCESPLRVSDLIGPHRWFEVLSGNSKNLLLKNEARYYEHVHPLI